MLWALVVDRRSWWGVGYGLRAYEQALLAWRLGPANVFDRCVCGGVLCLYVIALPEAAVVRLCPGMLMWLVVVAGVARVTLAPCLLALACCIAVTIFSGSRPLGVVLNGSSDDELDGPPQSFSLNMRSSAAHLQLQHSG